MLGEFFEYDNDQGLLPHLGLSARTWVCGGMACEVGVMSAVQKRVGTVCARQDPQRPLELCKSDLACTVTVRAVHVCFNMYM